MNLANVDLNLLVSLDALLRERNVTRAAQALGVSQPGMSNALARLRKLFGDPLLVRQGRVFALTPHAESLIGPVREILDQIQHTIADRPAFDPAHDSRVFTVSASDYATLVFAGPLMHRLSTEAPGVQLHMRPRSANVAEVLHEDKVDMVIEPEELMPGAPFPKRGLAKDRWLCAVWAGNPHVAGEMTLEVFQHLPHLVYSIGEGRTLSLADQHLQQLGVTRAVQFSVESFLLTPFMLKGTALTTLVPERTRPIFRGADIRMLRPPVPIPGITEALWWHPRHTLDPAHRWLRQCFADVAAGGRAMDGADPGDELDRS